MTFAQFSKSFETVIEAFGGPKKFPVIVLERMHKKCEDLSYHEMKTMCELLIDNCDHTPKTAKVIEFANMARAKHRSGEREQATEHQLACSMCFDLGVLRVNATDDNFETLMRCSCIEGHSCTYRLAMWDRDSARLFHKSHCPVEWFKPEMKVIGSKGEMKLMETIQSKINYWKAKIQIAEGYWRSLGD